jgi:two-component system LytT family response regulator
MRVLVVDDEPLARSRLIRMLQKIPAVESVAEAENGRRALEQIRLFNPNVVLLDIRMPGINGIEVARATRPAPDVGAAEGRGPRSQDTSQQFPLAIIFTTAHDEHALEAFEVAAIDYLLKPVRQERLEQALARVGGNVAASRDEDLAALYDRLRVSRDEEASLRITARKGDSVRVFEPSEIDRLTSARGYTSFQHGDEEFLLDESLNTLEEKLKPSGFLRVHRSELIRIGAVRAIHSGDGGTTVELAGGQRAPVSRRLLAELKNILGIRS